jgi:hypothetical protein
VRHNARARPLGRAARLGHAADPIPGRNHGRTSRSRQARPTPSNLPEDFDVSQREDVAKLRKHAVGLGGVLFLTVTGAAPISAMLFHTPIVVGFGQVVARQAKGSPVGPAKDGLGRVP